MASTRLRHRTADLLHRAAGTDLAPLRDCRRAARRPRSGRAASGPRACRQAGSQALARNGAEPGAEQLALPAAPREPKPKRTQAAHTAVSSSSHNHNEHMRPTQLSARLGHGFYSGSSLTGHTSPVWPRMYLSACDSSLIPCLRACFKLRSHWCRNPAEHLRTVKGRSYTGCRGLGVCLWGRQGLRSKQTGLPGRRCCSKVLHTYRCLCRPVRSTEVSQRLPTPQTPVSSCCYCCCGAPSKRCGDCGGIAAALTSSLSNASGRVGSVGLAPLLCTAAGAPWP